MRRSIESDTVWQVLVSQTVMSRINAPLLEETLPLQPKLLRKLSRGALNVAMDEGKAGKEGAELARMYVGMGKYQVPMNPDAWDGFQAERRKVCTRVCLVEVEFLYLMKVSLRCAYICSAVQPTAR